VADFRKARLGCAFTTNSAKARARARARAQHARGVRRNARNRRVDVTRVARMLKYFYYGIIARFHRRDGRSFAPQPERELFRSNGTASRSRTRLRPCRRLFRAESSRPARSRGFGCTRSFVHPSRIRVRLVEECGVLMKSGFDRALIRLKCLVGSFY